MIDNIRSYYHLSGVVSRKETECTIIMVDVTDYKKMEILLYENNIKMEKQLSELKLSESTIKQQNIELKKLNYDKDRFLSIIGHDLRNPFYVLLNLSELLSV